mgnify:CR=1 FL=1
MLSRKVLILGIDCLDYYLIRKWRLKPYILDCCGYHYVGTDLYTPVIWAKFLTGVDVSTYGFDSRKILKVKRIKSLYYLYDFFKYLQKITDEKIMPFLKKELLKQVNTSPYVSSSIIKKAFLKFIISDSHEDLRISEKILLRLLQKASQVERLPKKLMEKTFVHFAIRRGLRVMPIEFPPINDNIYSLIRIMLYFYIGSPVHERQIFLNHAWKLTKITLDLLLKKLEEYDLILWYTPYIDIASHMFYKPKNLRYMLKLYTVYRKLGNEIEKVVSKVYNDAIVLIVSDHGYNPARQDHSYFGYWSINLANIEKPRTILDFERLIRRLIL